MKIECKAPCKYSAINNMCNPNIRIHDEFHLTSIFESTPKTNYLTPSPKNTIRQLADTNFNMLICYILRKLVSWRLGVYSFLLTFRSRLILKSSFAIL